MENKKSEEGITIKKEEDMPEWYTQVCLKSGLAEYGPVKGTMIIKPYGYAIWQKIQDYFNKVLKEKKVSNAYFPMFIPESFFKKESEHAKGFEAEVAWLEQTDSDERIALRPTSETIMYDAYSRWIRSWRDLPLRINQWCNVVRWEVSQCKLFLRSREFLWQEGHCVYETESECDKEVMLFLDEYEKLCNNLLAIPLIKGKKTDKEKFAGAKYTTTIESFTSEGKALQCGTSHNLGQGFAKSFGISYLDKDGKKALPWQSSWGFSTRLIGALIMTHSDNKGLVLPPNIAPIQIVIIPIISSEKEKVLKKAREIYGELNKDYEIIIDEREEYSPGWKYSEYELKGVPIRLEIGPKDLEKEQVVLVRRDNGKKEFIKINKLKKEIKTISEDIQNSIFEKAKKFLDSQIIEISTWNQFVKEIKNKKLVLAKFCGNKECEEEIKEKTKGAGSRLIPFNQKKISGECVHCGKPARYWTYFSRSY
jgi:prolyl-tRNA synthetase